MKLVKFIIRIITLCLITTAILTIAVKNTFSQEQINSIVTIANINYEIPRELDDFKNTEEYRQLAKKVANINDFLSSPSTKYTVKYLSIINKSSFIPSLLSAILILVIFEVFVSKNFLKSLTFLGLNTFLSGLFFLILPYLLEIESSNQIITNLLSNFQKTAIPFLIIGLILIIVTLIIKKLTFLPKTN